MESGTQEKANTDMPVGRKKTTYFPRTPDAPGPIVAQVERSVRFSEVDAMGIVWYGRYPFYFEEGAEEVGRLCGLSYQDYYQEGLRAPIVKLHIDYHQSLRLAEEFTIRAALLWDEGSRISTEYSILKDDGSLAVSGYTVQLLTEAVTGEVLIIPPPLLQRCRARWKAGEFRNKPRKTV